MAQKAKGKAVLVTTSHRGVFYGRLLKPSDYVQEPQKGNPRITVSDARCVIRWTGGKGFINLAANGPEQGTKLGTKAPGAITLHDVTSVADVSDEAWERAQSWA